MCNTDTIIGNAVLYNWNLLRELNLNIPKKKKKEVSEVTDVLINLMGGGSFHSICMYQIIMLYILNNLHLYLSIIPQQSWGQILKA